MFELQTLTPSVQVLRSQLRHFIWTCLILRNPRLAGPSVTGWVQKHWTSSHLSAGAVEWKETATRKYIAMWIKSIYDFWWCIDIRLKDHKLQEEYRAFIQKKVFCLYHICRPLVLRQQLQAGCAMGTVPYFRQDTGLWLRSEEATRCSREYNDSVPWVFRLFRVLQVCPYLP